MLKLGSKGCAIHNQALDLRYPSRMFDRCNPKLLFSIRTFDRSDLLLLLLVVVVVLVLVLVPLNSLNLWRSSVGRLCCVWDVDGEADLPAFTFLLAFDFDRPEAQTKVRLAPYEVRVAVTPSLDAVRCPCEFVQVQLALE